MSVANLNAENRTMNNLVLAPSNRRVALTRLPRRCSFCFAQGHNINRCDDIRLIDIENECRQQKQLYALSETPTIMFRHWLCAKIIDNSILVKAFAVRKCGARIRSNIDECISKIINYVYQDIYNVRSNLDSLMPSLYHRMLMFMNFEENEAQINVDSKFKVVSKLENFDTEENCECAICYNDDAVINPTNFVKLNCAHIFCNSCMKKSFQHTNGLSIPRCALCRIEIASITFKDEHIKNDFCNNIISI
jgi:hypothetical protein